MKHLKRITALILATLLLSVCLPALAAPTYWGYDDYDTFENPGADEITSFPTTLTKISDKEYSMVSETEAGKMTITLWETNWGTFNLWKWNLVDKNGTTHTFLPGGTDLEYVYRTSITPKGTTYFTGGNHGNEALVSLNFYNGETGAKISLSNGQSVTVNELHIIEQTKLLYFPDANGDSVGDYINKNQSYTANDVFANVTRKYTVTGPQVRLNVDLDYVKEVYHGVSYTCMFPIAKKYGLYADMYDKDGKFVRTVETAEIGKADYSGPMNSGNKATRAILYGKNDSQYQFDIHINTYEDSLESQRNSFLTAFWDMNTTQNKLYFSKGDNTNLVKYEAGKQVHTECVWQFVYDPEGREPTIKDDENTESPAENLLSGKDYEISVTNDNPGSKEYNTSYLADLTDGVAATTFNASDDSWFAFSAYLPNIDTATKVGSVTVKLDGLHKIEKLRAHLFNNVAGMGVKAPKAAAVYGIVDGKEVKICDFTNIPSDDVKAYWITAEGSGVITDTLIFKFTLDGGFMYLNEIEAYGKEYDPDAPVNLALDKDYTISGCGTTYPPYTANLTDGNAATTISYDEKWFTFYNNGSDNSVINAPGGIGSIIINLEDIYDITSVKVNTIDLQGDSGIRGPKSMKVYLSDDGESWGNAIALTIPTSEKGVSYAIEGAINGKAQYVKLEVELNGIFAFFNEIEVYGKEVQSTDPDPDPEYTLGDVNADGAINQYDYILVKRHYFGTRILNDAEMKPADVNSDTKVDQYDYILICRHYFGTYVIG